MTTTPLPYQTPTPPAGAIFRPAAISLAIAAPTGLLLGTAECYAHIIRHEYLMVPTEILITLIFATALGLLLARLFRNLPSSSKPLTRLYTLAACTLAYYCAWIGWIANFVIYFSHNAPLPLFLHSHLRIFNVAIAMNYLGTWTLFGKPLHGPLLTCVWFAELFILFILTTRLVEWKSKLRSKR